MYAHDVTTAAAWHGSTAFPVTLGVAPQGAAYLVSHHWFAPFVGDVRSVGTSPARSTYRRHGYYSPSRQPPGWWGLLAQAHPHPQPFVLHRQNASARGLCHVRAYRRVDVWGSTPGRTARGSSSAPRTAWPRRVMRVIGFAVPLRWPASLVRTGPSGCELSCIGAVTYPPPRRPPIPSGLSRPAAALIMGVTKQPVAERRRRPRSRRNAWTTAVALRRSSFRRVLRARSLGSAPGNSRRSVPRPSALTRLAPCALPRVACLTRPGSDPPRHAPAHHLARPP